jgi:hypothetical protein
MTDRFDKFVWFVLREEDKELLTQYRSPRNETSLFKQIPIEHMDRVKKLAKQLGLNPRIVYRGPRRNQVDPSFTRRSDAERFSVYHREIG